MAEKNVLIKHAKLLIAVGVIGLSVAGWGYDAYLGTPPEREDEKPLVINSADWPVAPDFAFTDLKGEAHRLSDFKGKIVLIDFWATWCPPCVASFPKVTKFVGDHKGDVVLIALSSDNGLDPINDFVAKQSQDSRLRDILTQSYVYVALDKGRNVTRDIFLTESYPETIFVTPDQHMVKKTVGETNWDSAEMKKFFDALYRVKG